MPLQHCSRCCGATVPDALTLELAATAYEDSKDTPQAVGALRQAILLDPRNLNLYVDFANICSAHDSFQVGIDVVSDGIGQLPKAAPLYLARGVLYVQLGQYDKAEADFETAYELDPTPVAELSRAGIGWPSSRMIWIMRWQRCSQDCYASPMTRSALPSSGLSFPEGRRAGHARIFGQRCDRLKKLSRCGRGLAAPGRCWRSSTCRRATIRAAVEQCRKALDQDPKDQTALYHLIQGLRKTGDQREIPDLLKRLALLRKQSAHEESQTLPVQAGRRGHRNPSSRSAARAPLVELHSRFQQHIRAVAFFVDVHERTHGHAASVGRAGEPISFGVVCRLGLQQCVSLEAGLRIGHREEHERALHQGHQVRDDSRPPAPRARAWEARVQRGRHLSRCAGSRQKFPAARHRRFAFHSPRAPGPAPPSPEYGHTVCNPWPAMRTPGSGFCCRTDI